LPATVALSLDSVPQGASVSGTDGKALGETPLVLDLSRARSPIELVLSKPGFLATRFKVIPDNDKHAVAMLDAEETPAQQPAAPAASPAPSAPSVAPDPVPARAAGVKRHPRRPGVAPRVTPKPNPSRTATETLPSVRSRKNRAVGESAGVAPARHGGAFIHR
jgi:hypothetical protein